MPVWFEKQKPGGCSIETTSIWDVRKAIEECKNDDKCVALFDKGCNKKGHFGLCRKLSRFSSSQDCIYQKRTGN